MASSDWANENTLLRNEHKMNTINSILGVYLRFLFIDIRYSVLSPNTLTKVHGVKEFSVATIASNGAPGGAAGALKVGNAGVVYYQLYASV